MLGGGAGNCDVCERRNRKKLLGWSWGMLPRKILKSRVSEMPFPTFWGKNLQNSEGYETPYKNTQIRYTYMRKYSIKSLFALITCMV